VFRRRQTAQVKSEAVVDNSPILVYEYAGLPGYVLFNQRAEGSNVYFF
jgi:hypothetical protein